jgi:hypothetical protein
MATEAQLLYAAMQEARGPYEAALATMVYTQESIDNMRRLRYPVELAAYNYAVALGTRGIVEEQTPELPGVYPGLF